MSPLAGLRAANQLVLGLTPQALRFGR